MAIMDGTSADRSWASHAEALLLFGATLKLTSPLDFRHIIYKVRAQVIFSLLILVNLQETHHHPYILVWQELTWKSADLGFIVLIRLQGTHYLTYNLGAIG